MKKIIIIGGGVSGLSAAWKLSEHGYKTQIIEADKQIGGLAKSIKIDNYIMDVGPHSFFTEDKEVYDKILGLFKGEESAIPSSKRHCKMYFKGKYVDYPLTAKSILFQMGIISPILSTLSFLKSYFLNSIKSKKKINEKELTIEDWAINNFGKYLYLNFFKPYTEQFWKIKTPELSHKVIPFSKKMNFAETLKHLLIKKYLDISKREPGKFSLVERDTLPTYYPKKGFGEIANRIGNEVLKNNGEIITNCKAKEISFDDNSIKVKTDKKEFIGDYLISTIPLNNLMNKIFPKPKNSILDNSKKLNYLCLVIVFIITTKKNVIDCQYCYFLNRPYNRITELDKFSEETSPQNENLLSLEISCHYNDEMWNLSNEKIYEKCMNSIKADGFLNENDILDYKVFKVPDVYPIFRKGYDKNLDEVQNYIKKIKNFYSIGRIGQFYYGNIDQMARGGFDTAAKIIEEKN